MTAKSKRNSEPRRANKPLMEKRRRARINQSLAALKTLILDTAKADNTKHSKLEKADILELTVRHFQRHRSFDIPGVNHYRAGYADCVREVQRYLETPDAHTMTVIDPGVRQRLLRHLDNCVAEVDTDLRQPNINNNLITNNNLMTNSNNLINNGNNVITNNTTLNNNTTINNKNNIDERLQPPDSSTIEEVNNNARENNRTTNENNGTTVTVKTSSTSSASSSTLPTKMVKTYDGNFVFVLPSHYLQLATALGINIMPQTDAVQIETQLIQQQEHQQKQQQHPQQQQQQQRQHHQKNNEDEKMIEESNTEPEKPLDFSKNNENNVDMWRPW